MNNEADRLNSQFKVFHRHQEAWVESLKPQLEKYITNKDIPLEARLDFWYLAPEELKNHKNWIEHFECSGEEIELFDAMYLERHETVDVADTVIRHLYELVDKEEITQADFEATVENILERNLGTFVLDW